jgi:acetylornithine deacetylase/succinyl-diaminopimelate desuccinylase-like protein
MKPLQTPVKPFLDWKAATAETVENLQRLVRIDTTNPPGNELPAVLLIKEILLQNGFPGEDIQVLESAPGRANLVARLRGDGSKRPLLLSGHVDVVPVEPQHWSHAPFGAEIDAGYVWGRGTLDMKGFVSMYLETFLQAFRQGRKLKRDLIFAAIADEENGFTYGSKFLASQHKDLIDAEYGITEGGAMTIHMGKLRTYPIQVAEKGVTWLRMTAEGEPGHGSMPHANNAVLHLAQAIDRIRRNGHLPVHLTPTFLRMIDAIAAQLPFPTNLIGPLLHNRTSASLVLKLVPESSLRLLGPLFYNTVTPTVLKAGGKTNVIPSLAEAQLDCRSLPGQTPEDVIREVQQVVGPDVKLEILSSSTGAEFSTDTQLYRLMVKATQAMDPGGLVFPMLMMGATDACQYQNADIQMYGFTPGLFPKDFPFASLAHGHDERLPLSFIESGLPVLWQVVEEICA